MENETPVVEPQAPPQPDLKGQLIAERDQLNAAFQENGNVIRQIREELANREAAQQQIMGSIRTLNKLIGTQEGQDG